MAARLPGVSFIIPVYNKASYLPKVLAAIAAQTGDFPREFVFVDDGSTDDSLDLVRELTQGWENLTIIHQANRGSAHATNRAIERAAQPYLKFVDADDLLAAQATEVLLSALAPSDACLAYGGVYRYRDLSEFSLTIPCEGVTVSRLEEPLEAAMKNSLFNPTQFLARTECVRQVGACDERVVHSQEYGLTLRLAQHWPFLKVDATLAFLPRDVAGSLGGNQGRQLWRVTKALGLFVADHPEIAPRLQKFACRRAAGRAWRFTHRYGRGNWLSPHFSRYVASRIGLPANPGGFIEACATAFDERPPSNRRPPAS